MDLYFIDARSGKSRKVLTETSPEAWVNVNDDFRVTEIGRQVSVVELARRAHALVSIQLR